MKPSTYLQPRALCALLVLVTAMGPLARTAAAKDDLLGRDFEAFTGIPRESAHEIADTELDGYRGMAGILFFQVALTGLVDLNGNVFANLNVNAALGGQSGSITLPGTNATGPLKVAPTSTGGATVTPQSGTPFLVQADIGSSFNNASGIFQIGQIPGNNNTLMTRLDINVAFVTATPQLISSLQNQISATLAAH